MPVNYIYDLNNWLKTDAQLIALSGKQQLDIEPMLGYQGDVAPIILYWWYPGVYSREEFYIHRDMVKYAILDTNVDRLFNMTLRTIEVLNKGNLIYKAPSAQASAKWSILLNGSMKEPTAQRDGFFRSELNFEVAWTPIS